MSTVASTSGATEPLAVGITDFDFYAKFAKSLILTLDGSQDRIRAAAWFSKLRDVDSGSEKLRLDYLKLLLFVLQRRKLICPFSEDPDRAETLPNLEIGNDLAEIARKLIEREQFERRERIRQRMKGETGDSVAFTTDYSADLREYVAVQEIPNFGTHLYYAISKDPILDWENPEYAVFPKPVRRMEPLGNLSETSFGVMEPPAPEEPKRPKTPEESRRTPEPPTTPRTPRERKSPFAHMDRPAPPVGILPGDGETSQDTLPPPTWGSNLIEVREPIDKEGPDDIEIPSEPADMTLDISAIPPTFGWPPITPGAQPRKQTSSPLTYERSPERQRIPPSPQKQPTTPTRFSSPSPRYRSMLEPHEGTVDLNLSTTFPEFEWAPSSPDTSLSPPRRPSPQDPAVVRLLEQSMTVEDTLKELEQIEEDITGLDLPTNQAQELKLQAMDEALQNFHKRIQQQRALLLEEQQSTPTRQVKILTEDEGVVKLLVETPNAIHDTREEMLRKELRAPEDKRRSPPGRTGLSKAKAKGAILSPVEKKEVAAIEQQADVQVESPLSPPISPISPITRFRRNVREHQITPSFLERSQRGEASSSFRPKGLAGTAIQEEGSPPATIPDEEMTRIDDMFSELMEMMEKIERDEYQPETTIDYSARALERLLPPEAPSPTSPEADDIMNDTNKQLEVAERLNQLYEQISPDVPEEMRTPPPFSKHPDVRELGRQLRYDPTQFGLSRDEPFERGRGYFGRAAPPSPFTDPRDLRRIELREQELLADASGDRYQLDAEQFTFPDEAATPETPPWVGTEMMRRIVDRAERSMDSSPAISGGMGLTTPKSPATPKRSAVRRELMFESPPSYESPPPPSPPSPEHYPTPEFLRAKKLEYIIKARKQLHKEFEKELAEVKELARRVIEMREAQMAQMSSPEKPPRQPTPPPRIPTPPPLPPPPPLTPEFDRKMRAMQEAQREIEAELDRELAETRALAEEHAAIYERAARLLQKQTTPEKSPEKSPERKLPSWYSPYVTPPHLKIDHLLAQLPRTPETPAPPVRRVLDFSAYDEHVSPIGGELPPELAEDYEPTSPLDIPKFRRQLFEERVREIIPNQIIDIGLDISADMMPDLVPAQEPFDPEWEQTLQARWKQAVRQRLQDEGLGMEMADELMPELVPSELPWNPPPQQFENLPYAAIDEELPPEMVEDVITETLRQIADLERDATRLDIGEEAMPELQPAVDPPLSPLSELPFKLRRHQIDPQFLDRRRPLMTRQVQVGNRRVNLGRWEPPEAVRRGIREDTLGEEYQREKERLEQLEEEDRRLSQLERPIEDWSRIVQDVMTRGILLTATSQEREPIDIEEPPQEFIDLDVTPQTPPRTPISREEEPEFFASPGYPRPLTPPKTPPGLRTIDLSPYRRLGADVGLDEEFDESLLASPGLPEGYDFELRREFDEMRRFVPPSPPPPPPLSPRSQLNKELREHVVRFPRATEGGFQAGRRFVPLHSVPNPDLIPIYEELDYEGSKRVYYPKRDNRHLRSLPGLPPDSPLPEDLMGYAHSTRERERPSHILDEILAAELELPPPIGPTDWRPPSPDREARRRREALGAYARASAGRDVLLFEEPPQGIYLPDDEDESYDIRDMSVPESLMREGFYSPPPPRVQRRLDFSETEPTASQYYPIHLRSPERASPPRRHGRWSPEGRPYAPPVRMVPPPRPVPNPVVMRRMKETTITSQVYDPDSPESSMRRTRGRKVLEFNQPEAEASPVLTPPAQGVAVYARGPPTSAAGYADAPRTLPTPQPATPRGRPTRRRTGGATETPMRRDRLLPRRRLYEEEGGRRQLAAVREFLEGYEEVPQTSGTHPETGEGGRVEMVEDFDRTETEFIPEHLRGFRWMDEPDQDRFYEEFKRQFRQ